MAQYSMFWSLSDRVLAMGRIDEAERMMGPRLNELLRRAQEEDDFLDEWDVNKALNRAFGLAAATQKDAWFAWIFDYARLCRYAIPVELLDDIAAQIFVCRPAIGKQIAAYAQTVKDELLVACLDMIRLLCSE